MKNILFELALWTREKAQQNNLYVSIYLEHCRLREIRFKHNNLNALKRELSSRIHLILLDSSGRQSFATFNGFEDGGLKNQNPQALIAQLNALFEDTRRMMALIKTDPWRGYPTCLDSPKTNFIQGATLAEASAAGSNAMAKARETLLKLKETLSRKIPECEILEARVQCLDIHEAFINSLGTLLEKPVSKYEGDITLLIRGSQGAKTQSLFAQSRNLDVLLQKLETLALHKAQRAKDLLEARKMRAGRMPVILDNEVASDFLEVIASAFCADAAHKRTSPWNRNFLETPIASPSITIDDDGRPKGGVNGSLWDHEGSRTQKTRLVDKGILTGFLYDSYASKKDGTLSTGNARFNSQGFIAPKPSNVYIHPSGISPKKLIRDTGVGLYLTEAMGLHTIDPSSGEFSLSGCGYKIKQGETSEAVEGFVIQGNLYTLLKEIEIVASDLAAHRAIASPSLRVRMMEVGA